MVDQVSQQPYITFNNGQKLPQVGLGTFLSDNKVEAIIKKAILEDGYRHIDTASIYKNEEFIGNALQEVFATGPLKREDIYITTKLFANEYEDVEGALRASLAKLQTDYVDLYLVHWIRPFMTEDPETKAITVGRTPMHKIWA